LCNITLYFIYLGTRARSTAHARRPQFRQEVATDSANRVDLLLTSTRSEQGAHDDSAHWGSPQGAAW